MSKPNQTRSGKVGLYLHILKLIGIGRMFRIVFLVLLLFIAKEANSFLQPSRSCLSRGLRRFSSPADGFNEEDELFALSKEQNEDGYTRKQLLRAEAETPFLKVRLFFLGSLLVSAGLSFLTTLPAIIAVSSGVRRGDMTELGTNLAINSGGIVVIGALIKRDLDNQKARLERIAKGGALAALPLKIVSKETGTPLIVKLSDLRRDRGIEKRVVIVAAPRELLKTSIDSSISLSGDLNGNDLLVVPLIIDEANSQGEILVSFDNYLLNEIFDSRGEERDDKKSTHLGLPVEVKKWNDVLQKELNNALKQSKDALSMGATIVIKKNGKVGSRRLGVPIWEQLTEDVQIRKEIGLDTTNI